MPKHRLKILGRRNAVRVQKNVEQSRREGIE